MNNFHHEDGYVTQQQCLYYVVFLVATTYQPRNIGILTSSMGVVSSNDGGVPRFLSHGPKVGQVNITRYACTYPDSSFRYQNAKKSRRPGQELRLDTSPPALPRRRWISTVVLVLAGSALTQGGWNARGFYSQVEICPPFLMGKSTIHG
jgi:hypothetical protein